MSVTFGALGRMSRWTTGSFGTCLGPFLEVVTRDLQAVQISAYTGCHDWTCQWTRGHVGGPRLGVILPILIISTLQHGQKNRAGGLAVGGFVVETLVAGVDSCGCNCSLISSSFPRCLG